MGASSLQSRDVELLAYLAVGLACLLTLNLYFAPAAIAQDPIRSEPSASPTEPMAPTTTAVRPVSSPTTTTRIDPSARVPTIVARFESESKEPADLSGIRALASAMIANPEARVVLEGHSDLRGNDEYNHEISLGRADWVKGRVVDLGVTADRIETVGFGATRPLRHREGEAQAVNRRVEVRWITEESPPSPEEK